MVLDGWHGESLLFLAKSIPGWNDYLCVYAVEVCISVTWTSRVFTRWGYCGKPLSGGWCLIFEFIAVPVMVWYLIPECIAEGKMFYCESDYLVLLVGSCRRETLMVPGNTTWVWSMQIQPPNALMLQTRSSITFSLLVLKRWYWSSMQFSPLFQFGMKIHVL